MEATWNKPDDHVLQHDLRLSKKRQSDCLTHLINHLETVHNVCNSVQTFLSLCFLPIQFPKKKSNFISHLKLNFMCDRSCWTPMRKYSISQRIDTDVLFKCKTAFPFLDTLFSGHKQRLASLFNSWQMGIDWWRKNENQRSRKPKEDFRFVFGEGT